MKLQNPILSVQRLAAVASLALLVLLPAWPASAIYWENRIPAPNSLWDAVMFGADDVWVVGDSRTVAHWDGRVWVSDWGPGDLLDATTDCKAVWGTSSSNLWVATYQSGILYFDGSTWSVQHTGGLFSGLWGSSGSDVWAVGSSGRTVHWDGSAWTTVTSPTTEFLQAVWGSASNDVWAVGNNGTIIHWDGSAWSTVGSGVTVVLWDVWGSSATDVWAVGNSGTVLHWDGSAWSTVTAPTTSGLYAVGGLSSTEVYVAGAASSIYRWDGSGWSSTALPANWRIYGFTHDDAGTSSIYAVGETGFVLLEDGSGWTEVSSGSGEDLRGLFMFDNNRGFAVGENGTILRRWGWAWEAMTSGVSEDLNDVWGSGPLHAFAVGDGATLLEKDGSSWAAVSSGATGDLTAIHGWAADQAVVVGTGPEVLWYDGSSWTAGTAPAVSGNPTDVWGPAPNEVFVTTDAGEVAFWDGSTWTVASVDTTPLYCVWGTAGDDVYVGGESGACFHWDGSTWNDISTTETSGDIETLVGRTGSLVLAGTSDGELVEYNTATGTWGNAWGLLDPYGFTASSATGEAAWVAGSSGAIFRYDSQLFVRIEDGTATEGDPCSFLVRVDFPIWDVDVSYETQPGTAQEGTDYTATSGTVTIPASSYLHPWAVVDVPTVADGIDEPDETLRLVQTAVSTWAFSNGNGLGTIVDGDPPSELSVADISLDETVGIGHVTMTITPASGWDITVHVRSADGTATDPQDYAGKDKDVVIAPGNTSWDFLFPIVDDGLTEGYEEFTVTISDPVHATIAAATATVTIVDDDAYCGVGGDADDDCFMDAVDLALIVRLADDSSVPAAGDPDCDGSGTADAGDLPCVVAMIFGV